MMANDAEIDARASSIRLLILDADGVLTDGSLVYDARGSELKRFFVRDGFAIRCWQRAGYRVAVISGRYSQELAFRCRELGISPVVQRSPLKGPALKGVLRHCGIGAAEVCFVGDDLPDLPLILSVGLGVAVADADPLVRERAAWVTQAAGGRGAVREVIERLLSAQGRWGEVAEFYARPAIAGDS